MEIANLSHAIVDGALKSSPAIVERLQKAETALSALRRPPELPAMQHVELEFTRVVEKHRALEHIWPCARKTGRSYGLLGSRKPAAGSRRAYDSRRTHGRYNGCGGTLPSYPAISSKLST